MAEDSMKYFMIAQELNKECEEMLKSKQLHFRGNIGSFSLISLSQKTPEQGEGGFKDKKAALDFLENKIEALLESKRKKIDDGNSKKTPEKELQAWIINYAINNNNRLPFSNGLTFLTSELAFNDSGKIVNDILAVDQEGSLVVIELKSSRHKTTLEGQVEDFCGVIDSKQDFFRELVVVLAPGKVWNGRVRKIVVWPDANGQTRNDWSGGIEEVRYKPDQNSSLIDYVFL